MSNNLTLADVPDFSDWRLAPLWTLEQAALLWAGINPAFSTFEDIWKEHPRKQAWAKIALQAFLGGIVLKTLPVHELYLLDAGGWAYCDNQKTETFAKFLSLPTAETQTQVFGCFRPKYLLILPKYPLNPPRIPDNQASGLPFRRQRAHLTCWPLSTGSNTSPSGGFA
ncbi:TPA: hypothetical protein ACLA99_001876, partial [Neisseria meningitidis]